MFLDVIFMSKNMILDTEKNVNATQSIPKLKNEKKCKNFEVPFSRMCNVPKVKFLCSFSVISALFTPFFQQFSWGPPTSIPP